MKINNNLLKLEDDNIFLKVTQKVKKYKEKYPNKEILSLGIGDVSKPIVEPIIKAMKNAVNDLSDMKTFKGYGAYYGYDFLKEKILKNDYKNFNFSNDELYISNGTKTDTTNILELFDINSKILITDPMYPIYRDGAISMNRNIEVLPLKEENNFIPKPPKEKYDVIYICSPSNPIGVAFTKNDLELWVKYAIENNAVILYDNVYESFISSNDVPHSIYEIENSKKCSIEFKSFSKNASFTGVRCSYYVIPNDLYPNINKLWKKRTINRFNGADYIAQKGAEAVYQENTQVLIKDNINYYKENLNMLLNCFKSANFKVWGGNDSPYLWIKTKDNMNSWEMFDLFLNELNIIIIPGIIFGYSGDKYFRVSALGNREVVLKCIERINRYFKC